MIAIYNVEMNLVHANSVSNRKFVLENFDKTEFKSARVTLGVQMAAKTVTNRHVTAALVLRKKFYPLLMVNI